MKEDINLIEIKKYLRENGLDENLAESPFFVEKFSRAKNNTPHHRLAIYIDEENNLINIRFRDEAGRKIDGPSVRIRKEGKTILIEELSRSQGMGHFQTGDDAEVHSMTKTTFYLDESAEILLVKEIRTNFVLEREISEAELYGPPAKVQYEINEEELKDKNLVDYPIILMIKELSILQRDVQYLTEKNEKQSKMLETAISFAEAVRRSRVGRLFFKKKAREVFGENKGLPQAPDER